MATQKSQAQADCRFEAGHLMPQVNRNKCEAKADCVSVCPYNVFEVRKLTDNERKELSLVGQLKLRVHGGQQAFAVRATDCHGCGLCVTACPEKAIKSIKTQD